MHGTVLTDVASWRRLYLVAKPSHVGINVDGLTCPLQRPMACGHQMRGHGFLLGVALSHRAAMGSGAFLGDAKPPGLNI
jgi:hypothetical protein